MPTPVQNILLNHLAGLQTQLGPQAAIANAMTRLQALPERADRIDRFLLRRPDDHYDQAACDIVVDCKARLGSAGVENCAETLAARKCGLRGNPNDTVERMLAGAEELEAGARARISEENHLKAACHYYAASDLMKWARRTLLENGWTAGRETSDSLADILLKESALLLAARASFLDEMNWMKERALKSRDEDYLMVQEAALDVFAEFYWRVQAMGPDEQRVVQNLRKREGIEEKLKFNTYAIRSSLIRLPYKRGYERLQSSLSDKNPETFVERRVNLEAKRRLFEGVSE